MTEPSSPKATPKRKRDDLIIEQKLSSSAPVPNVPYLTKTVFTFEPPDYQSLEDGNSSPRTKVANKFRDLALDGNGQSGGGVGTTTHGRVSDKRGIDMRHPKFLPEPLVFDFDGAGDSGQEDKVDMDIDMDIHNVGDAARKRMKLPDMEPATAPGRHGESSAEAAGPVQIGANGRLLLETAIDPIMLKTRKDGEGGKLQKSYPSINRLADSKSRRPRRTGTPPLNARRKTTETVEEEPVIVDPVRAALTWHEDEITVYDSEDKDDDGTGLNGIGFKPTPAVAYARAQKRRQQLSDYRKREESEARARRNQRRREALGEPPGLERKHSMVKVHFSEAEPSAMVTT
ncbi:uncharacterized protein BCR38DRAFT_406193 [Pseudomassariella vexata]|uniref:Uncharacterized protein n=1 Tax=Pseudomassariella vexata TaxID=1141098 RepID=A0A1Y2E9M2_9PEZI|nr:uncharacterized protein BCR38DRAFT_406193 [Pseudomassariella vexata]ORY68249.1 hypothetical protein BCR38DRAFT_406193 [Pseudomassariella vexata]